MYESFSDLTGKQSTLDELVAFLRQFSRYSVVWLCSYLTTVLQLWDVEDLSSPNHAKVIQQVFPPPLSGRFQAGLWRSESRRTVFHRKQLLYLSRLALEHCPISGIDAAQHTGKFSLAFLLANDHFHHRSIPNRKIASHDRLGLAGIVTEFVGITEFSAKNLVRLFLRGNRMFSALPARRRDHTDFIDIDAALRVQLGMSYAEFGGLTFATATRYMGGWPSQILQAPENLVMPLGYFRTAKISSPVLLRYLSLVAYSLYKPDSAVIRKTAMPNDPTYFRKYPLLQHTYNFATINQFSGYLLSDLDLLLEKIVSGPFWALHSAYGEKFFRFWGLLFEDYANGLVQRSCAAHGCIFVPNPVHPDDPEHELCDGVILHEGTAVLLEYKAALLRADIKYSGDIVKLQKHLEDRLVQSADHKPKAVHQLATAVDVIFNRNRIAPSWIDRSVIKRCYTVTVCFDGIGGVTGISSLLETYFRPLLKEDELSVEVRPFYCTDIETLEVMTNANVPLAELLEHWFRTAPLLAMPFNAIDGSRYRVGAHASDSTEWEALAAAWSSTVIEI